MKQYYIYLLVLLTSASVLARTITKDYAVDPAVRKILDKHAGQIRSLLKKVEKGEQKHGVWRFKWLPDYYVKYGLARIEGIERMQEVIDCCNLSSITVADKRIYCTKSSSEQLSNRNCAIVIKKVKGIKNPPPITLDEVQQLCTIMHETGYISMTGSRRTKGPNYIRTKEGHFCLIDTESRYDHDLLLKGFLRFISTHDFNKDLSEEALKHILREIKQQVKRPSDASWAIEIITDTLQCQKGRPTWDYHSYIKTFCNALKNEYLY